MTTPESEQRPQELHGTTRRVRTGHGTAFVTINTNEQGNPLEVFTSLGKSNGCDQAMIEAIGRLTSLALRSNIKPEEIVDQLRGITCCPTWESGVPIKSVPDAIAFSLASFLQEKKNLS